MNLKQTPLVGGLYLVATPIGNARDITLRALDVLASADVIAAEDTRTARKLMEIHGIPLSSRPVIAYHDHSNAGARARIVQMILDGRSVAYVSEAGTPLIADPGFVLGRDVIAGGGEVIALPGASAVLSALTVAGLPTDRFLFAGFLPNARTARQKAIAELRDIPATLVFYESPKRVHDLLADLGNVIGTDREIAICRELTKKFEEVLRGSIADVEIEIADRTLKGEVVVLVDRAQGGAVSEDDLETALIEAMKSMRVKDASAAVAGALGLPQRQVYQAALALKNKD
jgi:16S rRNA (cytidine1402-2'-O)-methyltransferase